MQTATVSAQKDRCSLDIATIVCENVQAADGSSFPLYHVRFSEHRDGPQTGGYVRLLDILYRRTNESESDFKERATTYTENLELN